MKKSLVARGFIGAVASLLGVAAVGCGADVGPGAAGDSAEIGSTSEALVADTLDDIPTSRIGAASCVIHDTHANPAVDLLVVAGGHDLTPTDRSSINVYRPGTGWSTLGVSLATARSNLSGMQIPGHTNECVFVGGDVAGTKSKVTDRLTLNLSTGAFSIASTGTQDLVTARNYFPMLQCGTDKIVAFGGGNNSLEVYDPASNSGAGGWTKHSTVDISPSGTGAPFSGSYTRQAAVAVGTNASTNFLNFAIVGGDDGSSAVDKVDLIKMPSSCVTSNGNIKATRNAVSLATAREFAVAFQKDPANNDDVLVTAGDSSSASSLNSPLSSTEILDVDFTTTFASATKSSGTALPAVTRAPKLARLGATGAFYLIGGEDNSGTSSSTQSLASVYHYNPGVPSWTTETLNDDTSSNVQDRSFHVVEYLGTTGKIFSTAGQRIVNGTASTIVTMQQTN